MFIDLIITVKTVLGVRIPSWPMERGGAEPLNAHLLLVACPVRLPWWCLVRPGFQRKAISIFAVYVFFFTFKNFRGSYSSLVKMRTCLGGN